MPTPLVLERLDLGQTPGNRRGTQLRPGGAIHNRNAALIEAAVNALSGLNMVAGPVTKLAAGANPTASLTGAAPNYTLNLGLPEGAAGAGAPTSADILAIPEKDRVERRLEAAGVPEEPCLILDFARSVQFASRGAIAASIATLMSALAGSSYGRPSTATYFDSDGLLKTAANNVPRIEYDPLTRLPRGLLIENQARTNSIINNVGLAGVQMLGATQTANVSVSPDGTTTMSRFTSTVNGGPNTCFAQRIIAAIPNDTVMRTFSGFLRQGNTPVSSINILYNNGGTSVQATATVDWTTKTISGAGNPVLLDCGGGLYLASISLANNGSGNTNVTGRIYVRDQGSGNVIGDYVDTGTWQLEEGAAMSSPIITGASAVTRAADSGFLLDGAKWLPASGGLSACVEFSINERRASSGSEVVMFSNLAQTSTVRLFEGTGYANGAIFYVNTAAVTQYQSASYSTALRTPMRFAFAFSDQGYAFAKDTILSQQSNAASSPPTDLSRLFLGIDGFMGHLRKVIVWPLRISNAKVSAASNQAAWS